MNNLIRTLFILATCLFTNCAIRADSPSNYFFDPKLYTTEELTQELAEKTLDMCWAFGEDSHFRFVSGNDAIYFEVYLGDLPDIYNGFLARVKSKFIEREGKSKQLVFSYKIKNDGNEIINELDSQEKGHPNEYSYIVTDRRVIANAIPQSMSQDELASIIRERNILFYTGAGLSIASGVPAMNELNELLGLEEGERFLFSLESALEHPREFASKIRIFHQACCLNSPTRAHFALKELAILKNIRIVTENLDCLHEASGIYPYRVDPEHLRNEIGGVALSQFDYVVCIGLSHDDRGFLGWYKQQNPQGKIIAVNLNQPSYLGDEDFLVIGDLQEVIPAIQEAMIR